VNGEVDEKRRIFWHQFPNGFGERLKEILRRLRSFDYVFIISNGYSHSIRQICSNTCTNLARQVILFLYKYFYVNNDLAKSPQTCHTHQNNCLALTKIWTKTNKILQYHQSDQIKQGILKFRILMSFITITCPEYWTSLSSRETTGPT
jgi:hypothetical protein